MNDINREYERFLKQFEENHSNTIENGEQDVPPSCPETPVKSRKNFKRKSRRKNGSLWAHKTSGNIIRRYRLGLALVLLLILITAIVVICKSRSDAQGDNLSILKGVWIYDQYTEYEFDGKGSGCMCIDETDHYEFKYDVDKDILKIDYKLDYVNDCEYTFSIDDNELTLIGGKGTAEPGRVYRLNK